MNAIYFSKFRQITAGFGWYLRQFYGIKSQRTFELWHKMYVNWNYRPSSRLISGIFPWWTNDVVMENLDFTLKLRVIEITYSLEAGTIKLFGISAWIFHSVCNDRQQKDCKSDMFHRRKNSFFFFPAGYCWQSLSYHLFLQYYITQKYPTTYRWVTI